MPLPEGGKMPWPPRYLTPALTDMHTWDTWWGGDPDRLTTLYGGGTVNRLDPKPSQYAGGLVGRISRLWWGTPTPAGEQRTKLHVPIAGDICSMSSRLLFAEAPGATVADDATQDRLDEFMDDGMHATLQEAGEICAALGSVYLRSVWDQDLADRPWMDAVHPDAAVPEWQWGRLSAVTFWRCVAESDGQIWRHLERHDAGKIQHGLYQGTKDSLGRMVPLQDAPATAGFADQVDSEGRIATGVKGLAVSYMSNRMSRRWRTTPGCSRLGRSDLDGIEPLMDALDETYSAWMRDVRLAKGRILLSESMLESNGPGRGARWDPDREAYAPVNALQRVNDTPLINVSQFSIRAAEFQATAEDFIEQILRSAGYSSQTFGSQGDAATTATEITARERLSSLTRQEKTLRARPALAHQLQVLLAVDAVVFKSGVTPELPDVEFADSVVEDPLTLAQTLETLRRAQAASTETLVRLQHADWDDERIRDEVTIIRAETGMATEDPTEFGADEPPDEADAATQELIEG